jgi:hypothetical protein
MKQVFAIVPAGPGPIITFLVAAPLLAGLMLSIPRSPHVAFWFAAAVLGGVMVLLASFVYASRWVTCEVSPEGLAIRGDLYGRRLSREMLVTGEARVVDLTESPGYRPVWRTNGAGLPGYGSGWFRLGNGEKALIFVTDRRRVVYLPIRAGYAVLLSVLEPERFLAALRL